MLNVFNKKCFWNSIKTIENILLIERERQIQKFSNNLFGTQGPNMLFKFVFTIYDLIKNKKEELLLDSILENTKHILIQYLIGVDTTIRVK